MYRDVLQQVGLPKNEAQIYEALVGLGPANISVIARASKVNRRNVYDSLGNLLNKNLVMRVAGPHEHLYQAAEPKRLLDVLHEQRESIGAILGQLKETYKGKVPLEQTFISRGQEGMKNYWKYVLSQAGDSLFIGGKGAWHDVKIDDERKQYVAGCQKKGIKIQGIFDFEMLQSGKDIYTHYDPALTRFFPKGYSTKASCDICGDQVLLFAMPAERSVENTTIYNIISRPLADSFRIWFKFLWQQAKPFEKI